MAARRSAPAAGHRPPADGKQAAGRAQLPPDRAFRQGLRPCRLDLADRLALPERTGGGACGLRSYEECNDMSTGLQMKRQTTREDILPMAAYERSEEHTSELQSLMRISYAVF